MNSFCKMTRLNISSCQYPSCLILMLNKDFLEIVCNGHGIRYLKKKNKLLKRMSSSLQFICLGKENITKDLCLNGAVSPRVMHLRSQRFWPSPHTKGSLLFPEASCWWLRQNSVCSDDQCLRNPRLRSPGRPLRSWGSALVWWWRWWQWYRSLVLAVCPCSFVVASPHPRGGFCYSHPRRWPEPSGFSAPRFYCLSPECVCPASHCHLSEMVSNVFWIGCQRRWPRCGPLY